MIHSIIPVEMIFNEQEQEIKKSETIFYELKGMQFEVMPIGVSKGQIVRIIHAPLEAYLKPEYCPGATISILEQ